MQSELKIMFLQHMSFQKNLHTCKETGWRLLALLCKTMHVCTRVGSHLTQDNQTQPDRKQKFQPLAHATGLSWTQCLDEASELLQIPGEAEAILEGA